MKKKIKKKKDDTEQKVVFVFDETPSTEKDYEDLIVSYIALLHKWDRRQKQIK